MASLFCNFAVFQHHDTVCHSHRRKAVRDQQRHFALRQLREALEHFIFRARVQAGGRFVEYYQLRVAKICTRQRHLLPFAAREVHAALESQSQQLFVALR